MTYTQLPHLNRLAIEAAMKPDERIVCENATVVMDAAGNLSYFDNEIPVCLIKEAEK